MCKITLHWADYDILALVTLWEVKVRPHSPGCTIVQRRLAEISKSIGLKQKNKKQKKDCVCSGGEWDAVSLRSLCALEVNNSSKISSKLWPCWKNNPRVKNVDKFRCEQEKMRLICCRMLIWSDPGASPGHSRLPCCFQAASDRVEKEKHLWVQLLLTLNSYLSPNLSSLTSPTASCPLMRICAGTRRTWNISVTLF